MPSCQIISVSGGVALVSGNIFSGQQQQLIGGVQLKYSNTAQSGPVYVNLPNLSGTAPSALAASGGVLSSGGMTDGMEMIPGDSYFIPKSRLVSGILTPLISAPLAASGARMFWEAF